MKLLLAILALTTLSGCASYSTVIRTGCIFECAEWERILAEQGPIDPRGPVANSTHGISSTQVYLPNAGYNIIRSGSTVTVTQTSRSK
jgi:hypothetical protein